MAKTIKQVTDATTGEQFNTIYEALKVEPPKFERGDELEVNGKQVKVVEVIAYDRYHVKNKQAPFDSFIVLGSEIELEKGNE